MMFLSFVFIMAFYIKLHVRIPRSKIKVTERKKGHILDVARTLMVQMNVPKYLWIDVLCACHLINRMPFSVLHEKKNLCLYPDKPTCSMVPCVIDHTCFVQDFHPGLDKLSSRSNKCVFIGNSRTQKGYCCFDQAHRKYFT